ncbi:DNA-directed RNA polymerases I and III subunit RPAC2 [Nakaseomyces glabratus]|uniref:DNA-directed RNA polymerases I and III subunit RPAC2 n=1 Tax=Candida glabrata TaxID=5478 RepID=A0A0W0EN99_CANGB|nr:RNA polymerases L / 13 to 16 Kd subunits signature [Nakaseomyces glabratus]KAH7581433.1 RNA polymerases L / 13 to 16 Kd subunits signature [Nakaseomyces glabratus]KAH7582692.1 RNA polymerases L / 13 to 16 Kd subunits signature [Nakaseomyces glabratus]KAH7594995.1 RNA polymerases L / 13 to 16 Kd subunits signature [Nakaseomyces glabratus]KAH7611079.1 RNA polymerases L / 13 to 16 Kd subunits signature [Nakaseomyces glabratus]
MSTEERIAKAESEDVEMTNGDALENVEEEDIEDQEEESLKTKIKLLPQATSEDGTCASFQIAQEDHTLGNALRYIIMKNPEVEFCGYSIPHPSEELLNLRIQTYGNITAVDALQKGLDDLIDLCDAVKDKFVQRLQS